jgi:putative ABC transport system permease protein
MTAAKSFFSGVSSAFRLFRAQRSFVWAIVVTAALGLGANAALFSIVDGVFFGPLLFREPDRLVCMELKSQTFLRLAVKDRTRIGSLSPTGLMSDLWSALAFFQVDDEVEAASAVTGPFGAVHASAVSPNFFDVVGVPPRLGRPFMNHDARSSPRPVILSDSIWRRAFKADERVVGRVLEVPGTRNRGYCVVAGVMPPGFQFPRGTDLWLVSPVPFAAVGVGGLARVAPHASIEALRAQWPELTIVSLRDYVRPENARLSAFLLLGSTSLFLVAWLQAGSLFLSRTLKRLPELGLRTALGATRTQLKLHCLGETTLLMAAAGAFGCLLAPSLNAVAVSLLPWDLTAGQALAVSWRTFTFTLLMASLGGVLLGAVPASVLGERQTTFNTAGGALAMTGRRYRRLRSAVFVTQIAVVTALVYVSALAALSYLRLSERPLGFQAEGVWAITLPSFDYPAAIDSASNRILFSTYRSRVGETVDELSSRPQITSVAATSFFPMQERALTPALVRAESDPNGEWVETRTAVVSRGIVRTLGLSPLSGDEASPGEIASLPRSATADDQRAFALVTSSLAHHLERFGVPVGQHVVVGPTRRVKVVGVVPDLAVGRPDERVASTVLEFCASNGSSRLLVRARDGRLDMGPVIRAAVQRVWGQKTGAEVVRVSRLVSAASSGYRGRAIVLSLMAIFSLPIGALGLAGAVVHTCADRRREFGIRLALGATPRSLRVDLARQVIRLTALGVGTGAAAGLGAGHGMSGMLFGVGAWEPVIMLSVASVVASAVLVSAIVASVRATSLAAIEVLKGERAGLTER